MERRAKLATTAVAVLAVAGVAAFYVYDVILTRPKVERLRPSPAQAFGIDRANVAAPAFELAALDGSRVSLAALRGQVVFVNFWATWCPPCREEMPSMVRLGEELMAKYPGKFRMVAVSVDEGWAPVREYFSAPPFGRPPGVLAIALDADQTVTRAYYCSARGFCPEFKFPEPYIVDRNGKL